MAICLLSNLQMNYNALYVSLLCAAGEQAEDDGRGGAEGAGRRQLRQKPDHRWRQC